MMIGLSGVANDSAGQSTYSANRSRYTAFTSLSLGAAPASTTAVVTRNIAKQRQRRADPIPGTPRLPRSVLGRSSWAGGSAPIAFQQQESLPKISSDGADIKNAIAPFRSGFV